MTFYIQIIYAMHRRKLLIKIKVNLYFREEKSIKNALLYTKIQINKQRINKKVLKVLVCSSNYLISN